MKPEGPVTIPEFPQGLEWINGTAVPLSTLLGRHAVAVWFWDYCSLNSLRAMPYVQEWHRRYSAAGLQVFGVHSPQFPFAKDRARVEEAVCRLAINFPVVPDPNYTIWRHYGNEVWPALYLWDRRGVLAYYHFGEGDYEGAERAIQDALREIDPDLRAPEPMAALRRTDHAGVLVQVPTPHSYLEEDRSGRRLLAGDEMTIAYEGATAAAVLEGTGKLDVLVDGERRRTLHLDGPRLYKLVESGQHEQHEVRLYFRDDTLVYAFSFAPGPA
jgi:hypothetical protein